jgi:hypothetical protein
MYHLHFQAQGLVNLNQLGDTATPLGELCALFPDQPDGGSTSGKDVQGAIATLFNTFILNPDNTLDDAGEL